MGRIFRELRASGGAGLVAFSLWLALIGGGLAQAIPPQLSQVGAKLEFEVASVKQNKSDERPHSNFPLNPGPQYSASSGHLTATNMLLLQYLVFAYKMTSYQMQVIREQLPDWVRTEHFDIDARVAGEPTKDQMRAMMQSLLEERFKMQVHHETRQVPIFGLVLEKPGKMGPNLQPHPVDDPTCSNTPLPKSEAGAYPPACGAATSIAAKRPGLIAIGGRKVTIEMLTLGLTNISSDVQRPVIDQTGLRGDFDYTLEWVPEANSQSASSFAPDVVGPTFVEALREQLGLKLVPKKGPIDVIVLDHLEYPSAN